MGDVVDEREFDDHAAALAWARDTNEIDEEIQRVEFLGPEMEWRWAGALEGEQSRSAPEASQLIKESSRS